MFTQFATPVTFKPPAGGNTSTYTYTMYPSVAPPMLYVNGTAEDGGTFTLGSVLTMSAATGTIYYTTDGSDPRTSSSGFTVSSITLSGTTATVTLDDTDTGLDNGEEIYLGGATQTAYDGDFIIANVTVNSTAGTTTFTYTVTGSPTSPATPAIAGQPSLPPPPWAARSVPRPRSTPGRSRLRRARRSMPGSCPAVPGAPVIDAEFSPNLSALRVAEVMYDPLPATAAEIAAGYVVSDTSEPWKDFQYIEIENTGTQTLPLAGLQISGGIDFTFPAVSLAAGAYIVVCSDTAAFAIRYGTELKAEFGSNWQSLVVAGQFADHHLSDSSDEIELRRPTAASSRTSPTKAPGIRRPPAKALRWCPIALTRPLLSWIPVPAGMPAAHREARPGWPILSRSRRPVRSSSTR